MQYIETSAKEGTNIDQAFEKAVAMIYEKVDQGGIDLTQDTSGVRLGNEVRIEQVKGVKDRFSLTQESYGAARHGDGGACLC